MAGRGGHEDEKTMWGSGRMKRVGDTSLVIPSAQRLKARHEISSRVFGEAQATVRIAGCCPSPRLPPCRLHQ